MMTREIVAALHVEGFHVTARVDIPAQVASTDVDVIHPTMRGSAALARSAKGAPLQERKSLKETR